MDILAPSREDLVRELVISRTRRCPNFPTEGVTFLDFNQCFANGTTFSALIRLFAEKAEVGVGDVVLAPEARGFILGPAIAAQNGAGFIPLRKEGKLPDFGSLEKVFYDTEYSTTAICMDKELGTSHLASFKDKNILIYDDVLATGGTAAAAVDLALMLSPKSIQFCCIAEISALKGREKLLQNQCLSDEKIYSLVKF